MIANSFCLPTIKIMINHWFTYILYRMRFFSMNNPALLSPPPPLAGLHCFTGAQQAATHHQTPLAVRLTA